MKFFDNDLLALKEQKWKANFAISSKIEIALRSKYKLDLELFKLERELGLPPSQFTETLVGGGLTTYELLGHDIGDLEGFHVFEEDRSS